MAFSSRLGWGAAVGAYTIWGLSPLFWAQLRHIEGLEVLAHRILWSAVLAWILWLSLEGGRSWRSLRNPRMWLTAMASTALIAVNWFVFLWAVNHDRVTEVSIGYYTNPLLNVLLGRVVLGEHLSSRQALAVAFAAGGVGYLAFQFGSFPWVSLILAFSFALYGLVRKQASLTAVAGLAIETGLCAPLCVAYLVLAAPTTVSMSQGDLADLGLLLASGLFTATPLLLFAVGARRLRYSTMGMLQYLAPTLQLLCAVWVFDEPFEDTHAITFALIWSAVILYALEAVQHRVSKEGSPRARQARSVRP